MAITPEQAAAIVAAMCEGFGRIVPPGFELSVHDDALTLTSPATMAIYDFAENIGFKLESGLQPVDAVRDSIESFAEYLQDYITEEVTYPWPRDPRLGKSDFASVNSELRDGVLIVWFGQEEDGLTLPIRIPLPAELLNA